jgi:hypothetical protein
MITVNGKMEYCAFGHGFRRPDKKARYVMRPVSLS